MQVIFFDTAIEKFINLLNASTYAKVIKDVDLLAEYGYLLTMPHSKKVGRRLFELRTQGQEKVRIFYTYHNGVAILLHGFVKKTDKIPPKEMSIAIHKLNQLA